jgi:serine/threonine protein phosphatase PrpC
MCHDNFAGNGSGLFGIFDGHGGSQVSEYCSQVIPNVLRKIARSSRTSSITRRETSRESSLAPSPKLTNS